MRKWLNQLRERISGPTQPPATPAAAPAPAWRGPAWGAPEHSFRDIFNLHLHGTTLEQANQALAERYLYAGPSGPAILLRPSGAWITAYFAPALVAKVGFNKLASEIAREQGIWLIGYRIYAAQGLDVHYFHADEHVAGLAFSQDELEDEPQDAAIFATLGDVTSLVPRRAEQHPLDFHFALLAGLGIGDANLTWAEAVQQYERGVFQSAQLLTKS